MIVRFSFRAKEEFKNSAKFYESRVSGLGIRFKNEIDKHINFIRNNPKAAELKYDDIRVLVVKTFPFTIHYRIEKNLILILAIFHSSRNPNNLKF